MTKSPKDKAQFQVQQPTDPPSRFRRVRADKLVFLLPNLLTTANLFCGFFSIISSIRGHWSNAAIAIMLAAFTDGLDGRVARLTKTESKFGEQYDSMSDLVSFGVAPSILMFLWGLTPYGRLGWVAAFFYLACAALRLARFNVLKQSTEKRYFQGVASPIAACAVASAVMFYLDLGSPVGWRGVYMLVVMFVLAATMVSSIRYRSFKDLNIQSQQNFGYLLIAIVVFLVISAVPDRTLFPIFVAYIVTGPVFELWRLYRKSKLAPRRLRAKSIASEP